VNFKKAQLEHKLTAIKRKKAQELRNHKWKINKAKKVMMFKSNFPKCNQPSCAGWETGGYYQSEVSPNGNHLLHMHVLVKAPFKISDNGGQMKQSWFISSTEKGWKTNSSTEDFSCAWVGVPQNKWDCTSGFAQNQSLYAVHNDSMSKSVAVKKVKNEMDLFQPKYGIVLDKKMNIRATREYKQKHRLSSWKLGDMKPFFVSFSHSDD